MHFFFEFAKKRLIFSGENLFNCGDVFAIVRRAILEVAREEVRLLWRFEVGLRGGRLLPGYGNAAKPQTSPNARVEAQSFVRFLACAIRKRVPQCFKHRPQCAAFGERTDEEVAL